TPARAGRLSWQTSGSGPWPSIPRRPPPSMRVLLPEVSKERGRGATWSYLTIPGFNVFSNAISALAVDPQNPAVLYAGVANLGTLKSTDGGATWTAVLPVSASALAIDPQTPATVYAGATDTVYRSSDGGSTWSAVDLTPAPDQATGSATPLAIDPGTPTTLY